MHFHWDSLDTVISRLFRSITPPLINLFLLSFIFADELKKSGSVLASLPMLEQVDVSQTVDTEPPSNASPRNEFSETSDKTSSSAGDGSQEPENNDGFGFSDLLAEAATLLPRLLSDLSSGQIFEGLKGAGNVVYQTVLATITGILILAFVLDFLVRSLGLLAPVNITVNEVKLVQSKSLSTLFEKARTKLVATDKTDTDNQIPKYYAWLGVRAHLDGNEKQTSYLEGRRSLMSAIATNEQAFSYIKSYFVIAIFALLADFWTENLTFSNVTLLALIAVLAVTLMLRQIVLAQKIIRNDLETYLVAPGAGLYNHIPHQAAQPQARFFWGLFVFPWSELKAAYEDLKQLRTLD